MEGQFKERRHYARIPVAFKVNYSAENDPSKAIKESLSRNISEGGVLINVSEPIPISSVLNLEIHNPNLPKPIQTKGRVVWISEVEKNKIYDVGITYMQIEKKDAAVIKEYIGAVDLDKFLSHAVKSGASDLHIVSGQPPIMRVNGVLTPISEKKLNPEEARGLLYGFLTEEQRKKFEEDLELDASYSNEMGRYRVNIHQEKGQLSGAFRYITTEIRSLTELGLPPVVETLARKQNGLIIVTGPTGSGKTTTLAAMIDVINKERNCMIISLEDPIEYLYNPKKSVVRQREIGIDSHSFANALKHTLRQDVNVILVGEIRDLESIGIAITAAETGHLVLTTLHTTDAVACIDRIVDVFPSTQQQQIRLQLAATLRGVVAQILLPRADGKGRVIANEVLVCTNAVSNLIRAGTMEQIRTFMITGAQFGMLTMDNSLEKLYKQGLITREVAMTHVLDPARFPV